MIIDAKMRVSRRTSVGQKPWPSTTTLFVRFQKLIPFLHVRVRNSAKALDNAHISPLSMRLRNSLDPHYEQMGKNEGGHNNGQDEYVEEVHPRDCLGWSDVPANIAVATHPPMRGVDIAMLMPIVAAPNARLSHGRRYPE